MILYFTGTGNSEYVAKKIGDYLTDEVLNIFDKIRMFDYSEIHSEKPWVIVVPTYAWQIPRIVRDWISAAKLTGNKKVYFVMTCGDGIGNAGAYNKKLCDKKDLQYMGTAKIVMPENYIALFDAPDKKEVIKIVKKAQVVIRITAQIIEAEVYNEIYKPSILDKILSGVINQGFYRFYISAEKFYAKDNCISCGKCEKVCPYGNIKLKSIDIKNGKSNVKKPVWGNTCTHCMACICHCPQEAIEYGKTSVGKVRYKFPIKKDKI